MAGDNPVRDGKPKPGSLADALGREEGLENPPQRRFIHAAPLSRTVNGIGPGPSVPATERWRLTSFHLDSETQTPPTLAPMASRALVAKLIKTWVSCVLSPRTMPTGSIEYRHGA